MRNTKSWVPWVVVILAAFAWRMFLIDRFPGLHGFDSVTRVWDQHTLFVRHWLPLPQVPVVLIGMAGGGVAILQAVYALLASLAAAALGHAWSGWSPRVGIAFGLLLAVMPAFVVNSVSVYQEGSLLLFCGLALGFWPGGEDARGRSFAAIAALSAAELCRYEAWGLAVLLVAGAVLRQRYVLARRSLVAIAIPFLWMVTFPLRDAGTGAPLAHPPFEVDLAALTGAEVLSATLRHGESLLEHVSAEVTQAGLLLALWGLAVAIRRGGLLGREMPLFFLSLLGTTLLRAMINNLVTGRMALLPEIFVLGYAVIGLDDLIRRAPRRTAALAAGFVVAAAITLFAPRGYRQVAKESITWRPEASLAGALANLDPEAIVRIVPRNVPNSWGESALGAIFAHHPGLDARDPRWQFGLAGEIADPDILVIWDGERYAIQTKRPTTPP